MKGRKKSTIDSIKSEFQLKFKDKISFINKQGILCCMFEQGTEIADPAAKGEQMKNSRSSISLSLSKILSTEEKSQKIVYKRIQKLPSLPKLKSTLSVYLQEGLPKSSIETKRFNPSILGLSRGDNLKF